MSLKQILELVQLGLALGLVVLVLLQSHSTGLSSTFSNIAGLYRSKRGVERVVFILTIVIGILFVVNSLTLVLTN